MLIEAQIIKHKIINANKMLSYLLTHTLVNVCNILAYLARMNLQIQCSPKVTATKWVTGKSR